MKQPLSSVAETQAPLSWLCGLAAGAFNLGIGGSVAIGALQLIAGRQPEFSPGQLFSVVAGGAVVGLILAPAFVQARRYLQGGPVRQGALFGMMLLALLLMAVAPVALTRNEDSLPWLVASGSVFMGAAFAGYGTMLATALEELKRPLPPPPHASECCASQLTARSPRNAGLISFSNSNN